MGSTHIATNAVLSPQRVPAPQTTIESAAEPKGFCASVRTFLKGLVDTVWGAVAGFFNRIKNYFTQQPPTPVVAANQALTPPAQTSNQGPQHLPAQTHVATPPLNPGPQHLPAAPSSIIPPAQTRVITPNPNQEVVPPLPVRDPPFQPFTIKISTSNTSPNSFPISTLEEMSSKARELGQEVLDQHIPLCLDFRTSYSHYNFERIQEQGQEMRFIEELRTVADVITTRWNNLFYIAPKKTQPDEIQEGLTRRRYDNGVIEEVSSSLQQSTWEDWEGRRVYPNGKIEMGRFERFRLQQGTCIEEGITTYHLPATLVKSFSLDRCLIYADIKGEKRLIVICKKPNTDPIAFEYIQVDEEPIPTLAKIFQEMSHGNDHLDFNERTLNEVLSGPIDCGKFIQFLFDTDAFFFMNSYALCTLLNVFKEKGIAINLPRQDPKTGKTLLDLHAGCASTLKILLTTDPALLQRTEGMQSAFVQALLKRSTEAANVLFAAMQKQGIPLLPQELLFKKVAFSEGNVTLEELQLLSQADQKIAYRLANIYSQSDVERIMRTQLGAAK